MHGFTEIKPRKNVLRRLYLAVMLWFVGRAIQAAARCDKAVADEFRAMPEGYTFCLGAFPDGPWMVVGKTEQGRVKYLGADKNRQPVHLELGLKNAAHLFTLFTFRESTPTANARDRLYVSGDVPPGLRRGADPGHGSGLPAAQAGGQAGHQALSAMALEAPPVHPHPDLDPDRARLLKWRPP